MSEETFEDQPATKRDLAEIKEELSSEIEKTQEVLSSEIEKTRSGLKTEMKKGVRHLEEILKGPEGLGERLERVEKRVGLSV